MDLDESELGERENPDKAVDALCSTSIEDSFGMFGASKGQTKEHTKTIKSNK